MKKASGLLSYWCEVDISAMLIDLLTIIGF